MPLASKILTDACVFIFDAYGTLFDVHSAVTRHSAAIGSEAARFSEVWRAKQLEYSWVLSLSRRYEPFWILTERALDYAIARCPSVDPALRAPLLGAYRTLNAYPEARPALAAIRERGFRTGILSNGSPGMLESAVMSAELGELLDQVLSVDDAGVCKTHPDTYALVTSAFGVTPEQVVFVSSNRWDIAGAVAFGFRAVWVNRGGLPDEYHHLPPAAVVRELSDLV